MLLRDRKIRLVAHQAMDGGLFAIALWLAHLVRLEWTDFIFRTTHYVTDRITPFSTDYMGIFCVVFPLSILVLDANGFYKRPFLAPFGQMVWQLARSSGVCTVGLIMILYLLRLSCARGVILLFGFFSFGLVCVKEVILRWAYNRNVGQGQFKRRFVLLGTAADNARLLQGMPEGMREMEILAEFDLDSITVERLLLYLHEHAVNGVILNGRHASFGQVEKAIQACELEGIEAWLVADFFKTSISQTSLDDLYGHPVLVFHSGPHQAAWAQLAKQGIDFLGAAVLLVVFSPVMLVAALLIKSSSPGPVLFRQKRSGLNGKPFVMYKFRTMVSDAEQLKHEIAALNEMSGPVFKVTNDPRVTAAGRWLRKFSVDEFPQLFNVLGLDMSLVGPRPLPVEEVERFDDLAHRRRLSVKPGLTCLWQVAGRNDVSDFKEWVRLDLEYIDHWSLWLDFKILWRTIPVVLLGKGAR